MRISDWSSDVCSSDLHFHRDAHFLEVVDEIPGEAVVIVDDQDHGMRLNLSMDRAPASLLTIACFGGARDGFAGGGDERARFRSEERRVGQECDCTCRSRW